MWGNASQTHLLSLIKLQKRIVRIISYSSYKAHTDPIFTKLHILKFHQIYKYSIIMFMLKYYKNELPSVFNNMFNKNVDVHPYPARQCYKLHFSLTLAIMSVTSDKVTSGTIVMISTLQKLIYSHCRIMFILCFMPKRSI